MRTADDRLIDRLEAAETRKCAVRQRRELGWEDLERIDPLGLASITEIWTVHGRAPFRLQIVDDNAVPASRGHTTLENGVLVARVSEGIARRARFGEGDARFVVAEQLGHATLGHPAIRSALLDKYRARHFEGEDARRTMVSASGSLAFQAGVFAAALLIGDRAAPESASPEELSVRYGVDPLFARVYFVELAGTPSL